jgi:hypothetical protein
MWSQLFSVAGAVLVLTAYAGNQMKRLTTDHLSYQIMNLVGGTILVLAAIGVRQAGLILMEGAWALVSLVGLIRVLRTR